MCKQIQLRSGISAGMGRFKDMAEAAGAAKLAGQSKTQVFEVR